MDLWHRACPIESSLQQGKDESMWEIARRRFSQKPYSNGFDKRYETVKAELRKPNQGKSIAINRVKDNSTLNDKSLPKFLDTSWMSN